jgi:hypothetical protein
MIVELIEQMARGSMGTTSSEYGSISESTRDNTGPTANKMPTTGKANAAAENGENVRSLALQKGKRTDNDVIFYNFDRALPAETISCRGRH